MRPSLSASRFGPFHLDPAGYRLLRDGTPVTLSPKVIDLLMLLVARPGALVTKEEIHQVLWSDVAVTDNALTQVVSELRQALADDASSPKYVQTVPRRGYRFISSVETVAPPSTARPASGGATLGRSHARTIAVTEFVNVSGDADMAWLATGIAETVTNDLRAIRDLRVIDRQRTATGVVDTGGAQPDLLVVGSFQRSGDRLRITARVIDGATREALAHAKADGALVDVFPLQDALVRQLSAGLKVTLTPAASARLGMRETANLEAYRALTEGRLKLESLDPAEVPAAMAEFDRALVLDPACAQAHVGVGHARFWLFQASRARNRPDASEFAAAVAHTRRAIALDPDLAEAHAALAFFLASADQSLEAVAAGRLAVALEPGNWRHVFRLGVAAWGQERLECFETVEGWYPEFAYTYFGTAMVHVARGEVPLAEDVLRRGIGFEGRRSVRAERYPGRGLHWLLGLARLASGDVAAARAEFDRELAATGGEIYAAEYLMNAYDGHGFALLEAGDAAGAAAMFARALEQFPAHARSLVGQAMAERRRGQGELAGKIERHAVKAIDELRESGRLTEAALATAFWQVAAGRPDEAIGSLNKLLSDAPPGFAGWTIPIEPVLQTLRDRPGFRQVLARLAERAR